MTPASGSGASRAGGAEAASTVSVLDRALWSKFSEDQDLASFARVWLALAVRTLGPCPEAAVVVRTPRGLVPIALWPQDGSPSHAVMDAIELAMTEGRALVRRDTLVAQPFIVDGEALGAVCLNLAQAPADAADLLHRLRWASGWMVAALRRDLGQADRQDRGRAALVLDVVGAALDTRTHRGAAMAACNLLARELGCATVALGQARRRGRIRVTALSDVAERPRETDSTQAIALAMGEAFHQEGSILHPPREDGAFMVTQAHAELARDGRLGDLLTVPLFEGTGGAAIGALHLAKPAGARFSEMEMAAAEGAAAALGALLSGRERAERGVIRTAWDSLKGGLGRLLGPGYLGRKLALLAVAGIVAFFTFAMSEFRVTAQSELQGAVVRSLAAPFDGHIAVQFARAGDRVAAGDPLLALDERDLRIELTRWRTDLERYAGEYDRALAARDAAAARIAEANMQQARARADLVARQLERSVLRAPFDALVIEGDFSQSLGVAVRLGQEMFRLAPLDAYRVAIEVEERDLDELRVGQEGLLVLAPLPDQRFPFEVTQITPRMIAEDGRNYAIAEATLQDTAPELRPGMRGIAKVSIEERRLIAIWAQPIIDWFRLAAWRWLP
ncbi:HlyD family efflux transporter periplasmic adaptor subunit [Jannaschia ovalis]|uniref:HlyD family efflux transporter periplasmic adaptor subunit n=1 Tax=Jannaschia ovalis TaxID=3038773 RepID=A0ABY8L709_9RHOB|nr:HlyD family efflux transporter periplasmic adaptor subunit [Jannaschia sp. GRR-S6-38]WGH77169.1 HlyD family efflux transporter periplasmic adaptor subunit [Jannaschia sp. GRR-S6-38]